MIRDFGVRTMGRSAVAQGRIAHQGLELLGKIAGAGKPAVEGDIRNRTAGTGELFRRRKNSSALHVGHWSAVQVSSENTLALSGTDIGLRRNILNG